MKKEIYEKITAKKEFSQLPKKDVERAYEKFDDDKKTDYQKLKLTRNLLRKIFSSFSSRKLLSFKDKNLEWFLNKHKSTKERLEFYEEIYRRILEKINEKERINIIDLGAGINGLSYKFFNNPKINYIGIEAVGQLVDLMNRFFKKNKIKGKAHNFSLFELEKVKDLIKKQKGRKIILLFKVIDSLEVLERNYSKKLLDEISPISDLIVLSFPTKSLGKRQKFYVQRGWIVNFIKENFELLDDFEFGGERYLVFAKRENL